MNQSILWSIIIILALIILGLLAWNLRGQPAVVSPSPTPELPSPSPLPSPTPEPLNPVVEVSPQDPGASVTVDRAELLTNGFIAIHTDADGKPGPVIGTSDLLTVGTHTEIAIKLSRRARKGETLYAMLHDDANGDGVYEFPGVDIPTTDSTGTVVAPPFAIGPVASPSPTVTTPSPGATGSSPGTSLGATPAATPLSTASPSYSY